MPRKQVYSKAPVKKTADANEKLKYEDKFVSVTTTPLIQLHQERITKKFNLLSKTLLKHSIIWSKMPPSEQIILRNYVQNYYEYYEFDQFDQSFELLPSLDVNLYTVNNEEIVYKSLNIFSGAIWPIRFHSKFVSKATSYSANQIKYVLSFVYLLAQGEFYGKQALMQTKGFGEFGYVVPVNGQSLPHNRFFYLKLFREKNMLFSIGVEKKPILKGAVIKRYEYVNYILILDILSDQVIENPAKLEETVARFVQYLREDVAKKDHGEELSIEKEKGKKKVNHLFEEVLNPYINQSEVFPIEFESSLKYEYKPLNFKVNYVSVGDTSTVIFDKELKRWVTKDYLSQIEQRALNEYQRKVNQELIKRFVDFQSAKTLVELLTKIPNFKVELTEQEKDVIGENGNVLVIGRSGTGKTTCAVLRLFAIEMLFKIRLSLSKKKHEGELKDTKCSADDIDKTIGLHCVFLTASPVLTNEIERYYKKLTDNIKAELEKKKKRVEEEKRKQEGEKMKKKNVSAEESASNEQTDNEKYEEIVEKDESLEAPENLIAKKSEEAIEEENEMNKELGDINLNEKIENEQFNDEEENFDQMKDDLDKKMKRFKSLYDLGEEDYPGFFTVKSYIMMIDGTLPKPFFIRKEADSNEEESQATWHNEKKGVMMIENYYRNDEEEKDSLVEEEIEEEINYSDEEELEHEYLRQLQLRENKEKQKLTEKLSKNKKSLSFEVDYDYFLTFFWPNVKHRYYSDRNITPHLVWTEIYSTIKGSANSHMYLGYYLTEKAYIEESANSFLSKQEKLDVYETFCQYERWKIKSGGYDLMDSVNYILNYIRFKGYNGPDIHYVMIDEVQDLPHSIIYLLSKIAKYGVFYSGDTAQTIAKGIGFRFCDLKNLFDPKRFDQTIALQLQKPIVKQLTVNFRSHNNILQLANSVVSSIEILFPKTIDRLKKEISNISGPKPMILADGDLELLFYVLCGEEKYKKEEGKDGMKKPPLEFGCDQVIIVRDQESKNKIPSMLQHALCLTVYEAKGLEFNDVILFNFFSETKVANQWNLLKFLKIIVSEIDAAEYELSITKHEKSVPKEGEEVEEIVDVECIVEKNKNNNKLNIKKIVSDSKIYMKDINDYAELCSELKMLYTAITRPKNTLIIYDEDSTARKNIEKLWEKLDVIELISKELLEEASKKSKPESQELKIFQSIVNTTDKSDWKKQGLKMYSRGYFEQAMKCFQRSENDELYKKAEANHIADHSTKKLIEIESERTAIKNKLIQYQKMSESEISKLKKKLKRDEAQTFINFQSAGKIFEELLMFKQAGQCFFSGRQFEKAFDNFSRAFMNRQAGESLEMLNKFREASIYYEKEGLYLKAIQCLDMINEWESILKMIQKFSKEMSELEKKALIKKYSALALQELMYEIEFENEVEENKPESNRVEVIKEEENSEEEDWDSDEDPEIAAERSLSRKSSDNSMIASRKFSNISADESEPKRKESLIEDEKVIKESVYENIEHEKEEIKDEKEKQAELNPKADNTSFANLDESSSFSDLNESSELQRSKSLESQDKNLIQSVYENIQEKHIKNQEQKKIENNESGSFANLNDSSFADLNSESSQNDINIKYPSELEPDIESIKSMVDPDDMWVQNALSEIAAKTNTEYSIIDEEENYNSNVRIIKTKGNIIVQDKIMKKIVAIVSIVNDSVEEFFKQFKGYQSLTSVTKAENEDTIDNRPEIEEFEDIDLKLINIILDILESFKLYKLCLFVCNRYHLPHKAGRYLVSMALKYSTNSQINNTLNPALIAPSLSRKLELEKGILASIALHAIFENVSADFLKIKVHQIEKEESKNSLGSYFIEGLILEGLYKKAVFMVNPEESLRILNNFRDNTLYQEVYKQKFLKKSSEEAAEFLAEAPVGDQEEQYMIVRLTENLNNYNILNRLDTMSHRYYKEFNLLELRNKYIPEKLPSYTPLIKALLCEDKQNFTETISSEISKCLQTLEKGPSYKLYEVVAFLTTLINSESNYKYVFSLKISHFLDVLTLLRKIRKVLKKNITSKSYEVIQAVFSIYFSRMIDPCKSTKFINDGFSLVHRSSIICNEFVEELKKNKSETAFFFEQDYNYIVVKTIKLIEIVSKRFDLAYSKFLRARAELDEYQHKYKEGYLPTDFNELQSEYLLKVLLREEVRSMYPKDKRIKKETSKATRKPGKPNFNFKSQGRPELVVDLNESESSDTDEVHENKIEHHNLFVFPDLNPKFKSFSDIFLSAYFVKREENKSGKMISGRLLYCAGLNDSFKEYTQKREEDPSANLYNAIEYRKFNRLDMYADNLLSVIHELSYTERHFYFAEVLILLIVQYRISVNGKNFKLEIPRKFLKFLQNLKLIEIIGVAEQAVHPNINENLHENKHACAFSYMNYFSCELETNDIADLICEFLEILRIEKNYNCFSIEKLILLIFVNIPNNQKVFEALRDLAETAAYIIKSTFLDELKSCDQYEEIVKLREKVLKDRQSVLKNSILHEIRVTDRSDIDKNIKESEIDYEIKEKILQARIKAVSKISIWWRSVKNKIKPHDQIEIIRENRIIKMTYGIKYVPIDDRFILRSSTVRQVLFSFYLNNIVTSSLDFHFILMTLNKISNLRREYINAYSTHNQALVELNNNEIDFEQEIINIEDSVKIWKNDEKWLKDRNIDLKRKKVFEVKWMTKNVMGSLAKRRAGLNKQKKLQDKKKFLKKFNL